MERAQAVSIPIFALADGLNLVSDHPASTAAGDFETFVTHSSLHLVCVCVWVTGPFCTAKGCCARCLFSVFSVAKITLNLVIPFFDRWKKMAFARRVDYS